MGNENSRREEERAVPLSEGVEKVVYNEKVMFLLNGSGGIVRAYRVG